MAQTQLLDYISALGVTAVELVPVHAYLDDHSLLNKGLRNYWGYNTLAFFAMKSRYLASVHRDEFRDMVNAMHRKGLEVILDVVYNHTAGGNKLGPTLSFKDIDNASYYRLAEDKRYDINDTGTGTGTGNTFNLSSLQAIRLVNDSLRYWAQDMHVAGFRFDLATILGREPGGFDQRGGFLDAVGQDPRLSQVKLSAEPWDCDPGGYQVGRFPPGWAEWNDKFRDTSRSFWKGDEGQLAELAPVPPDLPICSIAVAGGRGHRSILSPPMTDSTSMNWSATTPNTIRLTARTTVFVPVTTRPATMVSRVRVTTPRSTHCASSR